MSDQQENVAQVSGFVSGLDETSPSLPGALLAAQRQAKGWSVEHVASQLKFAARQVAALEAENYAALPGPVIVRGFVRAYAKLLGMDANALVALLPQENATPGERITPQRTLSTPFSESPLPLGNRKKLSPLWFVGGVLVVVFAGAAALLHNTDLSNKLPQFAWFKHDSAPSVTQDDAAVQTPPDQAELPPEVQDSADHGKSEKNDAATDAAATTPNSSITAVSEKVDAADVMPAAQSPAVAAKPVVAAPAVNSASQVTGNLNISKSKDLLRLNFREDSWVEIRRGDNSTMISRLLKAGTAEAFDITEPVTLIIGNVAGVDASLRGAKLDLQASNNSNVARLNLK